MAQEKKFLYFFEGEPIEMEEILEMRDQEIQQLNLALYVNGDTSKHPENRNLIRNCKRYKENATHALK